LSVNLLPSPLDVSDHLIQSQPSEDLVALGHVVVTRHALVVLARRWSTCPANRFERALR